MRRASEITRYIGKEKESFLQKPRSYGLCDVGKQKKTKYATHKDGQTQIEIIKLKNPLVAKELVTYKCPKCNMIHLKHKDSQVERYKNFGQKRLEYILHVWKNPRRELTRKILRFIWIDLAKVLDETVSSPTEGSR